MIDRVEELYQWLYRLYGEDSGVLFGIPAKHQPVIKKIIELVLREDERRRQEEERE